MKKTPRLLVVFILLCAVTLIATMCNSNDKSQSVSANPVLDTSGQSGAFLNYRDSAPSKEQYSDSLFVLSHYYPATVAPVVNPSWEQALNGQPISEKNVFAYMDSLKTHVAPTLLPFLTNNKAWTAAKYGWFQEPWLGSQREAILGAYLGNGNPANMFDSLNVDEAGYALVLYDSTAGYTVGQIWGKTGQKVNLVNDAAQFKEGSIIIKFAFSNINYPAWPAMQGAQIFNIYDTIATAENPKTGYQVRNVSFFQLDVIVKDSKAAPKTGWVYSTFVYDKNVPGSIWDKMVPLGAMWGNDPGVNSLETPPYPKLSETIINPKAPAYSKETLGWGGRLSGPNDGSVALNVTDASGKQYKRFAFSSCMSCHSPAQDTLKSPIVPVSTSTGNFYAPGSKEWNLWFRDDYGNVPFDSGQVAMDYDLVMAFKSVPAYLAAQPTGQSKLLKNNLEVINKFRFRHGHSQFWH